MSSASKVEEAKRALLTAAAQTRGGRVIAVPRQRYAKTLHELEKDGLVRIHGWDIWITDKGRKSVGGLTESELFHKELAEIVSGERVI